MQRETAPLGCARRKGTDVAGRISRRRFIQTTAGAAGALTLGGADVLLAGAPALPPPHRSGIDHIVVVMMENRSFDHMMGWVPGADGRQAGLSFTDRDGVAHATYPLAPDFQGCGHPDPDHSYDGGRIEFNNGACDGWLRAGENDLYAIGYYTDADLPFFAGAARDWTVCDQYFSPIMGPTFPNRFYHHCAQTDRITNSFELSTLPTIWDRLAARDVRARYYFSDVPFLALWGTKYISVARHIASFFDACRTGRLPPVSFVEPRFIEESTGISNDDHPHADVRDGQAFQNLIYTAVANSRNWHNTMLVFVYDEWGGFYDHVPPSAAVTSAIDRAAGNADGLRGFRVPCLVMSPYARRRHVAHTVFDHTSILRFIEWRWNLEPLTERDATANNLATELDFSTRNLRAPFYPMDPGPYATFCAPSELDKWETIREMASAYGF
jgi:phospholipase C